ncbi:YoaK family protein [Novosphingobium beihaiensis]|uniref:DUF1275 domain-containing protein n=1 Tax=Novosphingobium beihaiensis TaxID=2930389 RepID=A0ABT0BR65_9SPHN|nr:YoaK family protein [Novosphingobium beihaiensis]MCJ2187542.1 DUF1275 domain-containing protein [Novosphingobium beihaiensis]
MHSLDRPRKFLAAALSALAGYIDAVGYLSADRYFVSFMSGNTTRFGTDLVTEGNTAIIPALLISGFVLGVALGNVVAHRAGAWRKPAVLTLVTSLLVLGAICALMQYVAAMMACLVLAMGALNNTLRKGETPVALTYLTGALVRIGQGLGGMITRQRQDPAWPFIVLWFSLAAGAATGAASFLSLGPLSLCIGAGFSAMLTFAGYRIARANLQP